MPKVKVKITVKSIFHHLSQIYTGFELLKKSDKISLDYHFAPEMERMNFTSICEIEGKKVVFEVGDSVHIDQKLYESCDFFFKRMVLKEDLKTYPKLYPLGFNNAVYHHNNKFLRLFFRNNKEVHKKDIFKFNKYLALAIRKQESVLTSNLNTLQREASPSLPDRIFFCARIWPLDSFNEEERIMECDKINNERIKLVHSLKKNFGDKFIGGIQSCSFAMKHCPDLLLPKSFSNKRSYLENLKKCTIGVANQGLFNSVGWKFTEYISNSCAIVTSPINEFAFPGRFEEQRNYLSYNNLDECISNIELLLTNRDLKNSMMINNHQYYKDYLHPEKLVQNAIEIVLQS